MNLKLYKKLTATAQSGCLQRFVRRLLRVQQDWHGEWRIYLFNRYTSLCWMDPREWRQGWWISYRKTAYDHGQTLYGIRLLGFDYHWSTYAR